MGTGGQRQLSGSPYLLAAPHPPPTSGEEEELKVESIANGQWFRQSGLCNEASIKNPRGRGWKSFLVEHVAAQGEWRAWRGCEILRILPHAFPYGSLPSGYS